MVSEAIRQNLTLVALCCLGALGLTFAYAYLFPPVFVVSARVMVEAPIDNSRDSFYTQWAVFRKDDARTELELMVAPGLIAQVIKSEGLKWEDVYHPLPSHLIYLLKSSWPGRTYLRVKEALFPKKPEPDAPTPEQIELGKSVSDMKKGVTIVAVTDSNIGELTVKGPSRRVTQMANTLLDLYLKQRSERHRDEAQRNLDALDSELAVAAKEAQDIADARLAYQESNGLVFDLSKESQQLTKLVELEDGIAAARAKVASLDASLASIEGQLTVEPPSKTSSVVTELNPIRESLKQRRLDQETALIALRALYREDSPEIREVTKTIADLDALIVRQPEKIEKIQTSTLNSVRQDLVVSRNSLRSQLDGTAAGAKVMEETQRRMRSRLTDVPSVQNKMRDFDRKFSLVQDRYQALSAKRAQAAVSRAMAGLGMSSMRIVQPASSPDEPVMPNGKVLYPSALFVGAVLGMLGAVVRRLLSGRVFRTDLESGLNAVPIYGAISIPLNEVPFAVRSKREAWGDSGPGSNKYA
jgi:uncharacterized protein involved in exopolysaccharide biosynthesis